MSHRSVFVSIMITVLLCSVSARAQGSAPRAGSDESEKEVARKKAIELLGVVAGQINGLRSAENRARIGSNVADLLWEHDEKRARGLFAAVQEDIKAALNSVNDDDAAEKRTLSIFLRLRSDILDRIATHDPEFALEFMRATRPNPDLALGVMRAMRPMDQVRISDKMRTGEKSMQLRLARQLASKSPQLALKLGRESLADGFSNDLSGVLTQLQRKDKEAALNLFRDIVDKLKSANLAQDWSANELALNLAQSFQPPDADEQVYRDLIGIVLASSLNYGCADGPMEYASEICREVGLLFSRIEKYYGPRAAAWKRWARPEVQPYFPRRFLAALENGSVDEMLALAPQYPAMQDQIYWGAMMKSEALGDVARARQIAAEVPDEDLRRRMFAQLDRDRMWTSANEERLAAIQDELNRLHSDEERIHFLLNMAGRIGANDRKAALALLNQAGQIIDSTKPGKTQITGQVALAIQYCSLKSERGFAIMESLLPKLNELVTAAATLDGFENRYLRDGEWNMTGEGVMGGLLTNLAQHIGSFAALDFDRSVTLASQMERPELRLMAQSKIAQAILTEQSNAAKIPRFAAFGAP